MDYMGPSVIISRRPCVQTGTAGPKHDPRNSSGHPHRGRRRTGHPDDRRNHRHGGLDAGLHVKQSEVHGMAQRGGAVARTCGCQIGRSRPT